MSIPTLVDTDIIIDSARGVVAAINCLNHIRATSSLAICVVTQMELIVGCRNKSELRTLEKFLKKFQVVPLDAAISNKAVELLQQYRLSHGLLVADSLIAATATSLNWAFVTKNQKHYRFISGLNLLPYS
jgi:predicted nucleic acid-binding protein